ncbi:DUF1737 domain-containing protein [Muricauda sp. CAU 1633]|uniref:DUF1737 domain-containing protein n=1 Tax=Allomuricauda sp. CAU 1633 TaxID=2816036 RepID=UPI001A8DBB85|nr:DUF1737 domain-containing protein [Muricauda sp. CAU 1633]MBO0322177.1 DUF1737 domain-containing protein [Muricauda sp. CAU 1633]
MKYKVLLHTDREVLASLVEEHLNIDWSLEGVSMTVNSENDIAFAQAMTKT